MRVEHPTFYRTVTIDGLSIFYREAVRATAPTLSPACTDSRSSSRMFESLFARLSDRYHLVAPDYPGFGPQRLAGPGDICVHLRSLRGYHHPLHRSARTLALHAVHAGLRRARGVSHGFGPSGPGRRSHRAGRSGAQRRVGANWKTRRRLLGPIALPTKARFAHQSPVTGHDADATSWERPQRGALRSGSLDR